MALKIPFKDFLAKYPFRFKARATPEEMNKFMSGIEANIEITPNFEVDQGTELNEAFFTNLETDINKELEAKAGVSHGHDFSEITTGLPDAYPPSPHGHNAATTSTDGFMSSSDKTKLNGVAQGANNYVHPGSGTNPHGTTKADVGLGSVQNYGIATQAQVDAATANNLYVTPLGLAGLKDSVSSGKTAIASAITAKGVAASGSDTHATLANKIGQIPLLIKTLSPHKDIIVNGSIHLTGWTYDMEFPTISSDQIMKVTYTCTRCDSGSLKVIASASSTPSPFATFTKGVVVTQIHAASRPSNTFYLKGSASNVTVTVLVEVFDGNNI